MTIKTGLEKVFLIVLLPSSYLKNKRIVTYYDITQMIIEQVLDWCRRETDGMESDLCSILSFTWYSENCRRFN
jgi:hypothetical protein